MARISDNGLFSGTVGNLSYRVHNGVNYVYAKTDRVSNPRTDAQVAHRMKLRNILNVYGRIKHALTDNFEGKTGRQSDYTHFQSQNLMLKAVPLTKAEAEGRYNIVAPYKVSNGKLQTISYKLEDNVLISDLYIGAQDWNEQLTISDFTEYIVKRNENWSYNDTLEFICCKQDISGNDHRPWIDCEFINLTLDLNDFRKIKDVLGNIKVCCSAEGFLCVEAPRDGGYALVHKRYSGKKTLASTQQLAVKNALLDTYSTPEQMEMAVKSYQKKR